MTLLDLEKRLASLTLGDLRYFDRIDSTNLEAARWAEQGAPDLALIVADEQTTGRGRLGRKWFTPPGAALAFSLVLRRIAPPSPHSDAHESLVRGFGRLTALGALAVCQTLQENYGLPAQIKWPNDIIVEGMKLAGVLVEAYWSGDFLAAAILGLGINVTQEAIPSEGMARFPATCVESALGIPVKRWELLRDVLERLLFWNRHLFDLDFIRTWEKNLAWRGDWVRIVEDNGSSERIERFGQIIGLDLEGHLTLIDQVGEMFTIGSGEVSMV